MRREPSLLRGDHLNWHQSPSWRISRPPEENTVWVRQKLSCLVFFNPDGPLSSFIHLHTIPLSVPFPANSKQNEWYKTMDFFVCVACRWQFLHIVLSKQCDKEFNLFQPLLNPLFKQIMKWIQIVLLMHSDVKLPQMTSLFKLDNPWCNVQHYGPSRCNWTYIEQDTLQHNQTRLVSRKVGYQSSGKTQETQGTYCNNIISSFKPEFCNFAL